MEIQRESLCLALTFHQYVLFVLNRDINRNIVQICLLFVSYVTRLTTRRLSAQKTKARRKPLIYLLHALHLLLALRQSYQRSFLKPRKVLSRLSIRLSSSPVSHDGFTQRHRDSRFICCLDSSSLLLEFEASSFLDFV